MRPALEQIEARRVLAYPTETVYGFGGGIDRDSVDALVALKSRPPGKPFLLLIAGTGHDRAARPAVCRATRRISWRDTGPGR